MINIEQQGKPFSVTHTHATAAKAALAAAAGKTYYITDIMVASDTDDAIMIVTQGTTVIWQASIQTVATGMNVINHTFRSPLVAATGALVSVEITGTSICQANIAGFII